MASGVRHRHDNLSADILKMMLRFSSRRGAEPIVEEFLNLYATFLNNVFMQLVYPKQLTKFFDGDKFFGLSTAKKANRPITIVATHQKLADKIILASIQEKIPAVLNGVQY